MRTLLILAMAMCALLFGCQSQNQEPQNPGPQTSDAYPTFIGMVENGAFRILLPKGVSTESVGLTSIGMQMSVSVESGELKLKKYEGLAIAVKGHYGGDWIYSASVIDEGSPIVTILVLQAFGSKNQPETANGQNNAYLTFIGIVENGAFRILFPKGVSTESVGLTSIRMREASPPETGELELKKYEDLAIAVKGHYGGEWIYYAKIIDASGPILTALALQAFGL